MNIKTLLVFIAILSAILENLYAKEAVQQDSVKRVYVTVVAAERSLAERFSEFEGATEIESGPLNTNQESTPRRRTVNKKPSASSENVLSVSKAERRNSAKAEDNSGMSIIIKKQKRENRPVSANNNTDKTEVQDKVAHTSVAADDEGFSATEAPAIKTSKIYLWAGMVLIVIGVILGILFGKTALVVSVAGIVFVIIGYTIKT